MGHTHHDDHPTTVVTEREGMSGALVAIIAIVLVLLLIWAIFFSGWVVNRDNDTADTTNIEQREGDTEVNVPPADQSDTSNDTTEENQQDQPVPQQSP